MGEEPLEAAVTYLRGNRRPSFESESARHQGVAARLEPVFRAASDGDPTWVDSLRRELRDQAGDVSGVVADQFVEYAATYSYAVGRAAAGFEGPEDADLFWDVALTPVAGVTGLRERFADLGRPGAMASIVSMVLFSRRPRTYPVYQANLSSRTLRVLLGEPLDTHSIPSRLLSYYSGVERVGRWLKERGLAVRSNLDAYCILRALDKKRIVRPHGAQHIEPVGAGRTGR